MEADRVLPEGKMIWPPGPPELAELYALHPSEAAGAYDVLEAFNPRSMQGILSLHHGFCQRTPALLPSPPLRSPALATNLQCADAVCP
jgi:hypothetical protein